MLATAHLMLIGSCTVSNRLPIGRCRKCYSRHLPPPLQVDLSINQSNHNQIKTERVKKIQLKRRKGGTEKVREKKKKKFETLQNVNITDAVSATQNPIASISLVTSYSPPVPDGEEDERVWMQGQEEEDEYERHDNLPAGGDTACCRDSVNGASGTNGARPS